MRVIRFDIARPDGRRESIHVDSGRIVIGSGAHCELRLPADVCAPEHAIIEVIGGDLRVEARAFDPPLMLDGTPTTRAALTADGTLGIGPVRIRWSAGDPRLVQRKTPVVKAAAPIAAGLALFSLAVGVVVGRSAPKGGEPTVADLWPGPVGQCPVASPVRAHALAGEKRVVADSKRERSPFHPSDGVEAVSLYQTASACVRVAGDTDLAQQLADLADQLKREVTWSYRVRRLRLERALATGDLETAGAEVVTLRELTSGRQGSYVDWLNSLARKLNVGNEDE